MSVEFHDFSIEVKDVLEEKALQFLYEAAGELEAQTKRNVPNKGNWFTDQKNAWRYEVDEGRLEATVGNPQERSLWTEFGTGEYSISPKGGRKGYWIYVKEADGGGDGTTYAYKGGKAYTLDEAKKLVAMMREDGLDAYYTKGQRPYKPFQTAYTKLRPKLIRLAEQIFKGV